MYKIKFKDVEVEVESGQEAAYLVQILQKRTNNIHAPEVKQSIMGKRPKYNRKIMWNKEEIFFILDNPEIKTKDLIKCPELKAHSDSAINSMRSKSKSDKAVMGPKVASFVKEYWALRPRI